MRRLLPLTLLICLPACSDYKLSSENDASEGEDPDIQVEPSAISQIVCVEGERDVTVSNVGGATLEVDATIQEAAGWALTAPAGVFTLEPGESRVISVIGTDGTGNLRFQSNDPDEPEVRVPLESALDQPPAVTITAPTDADILSVGGPVTLTAQVSDDQDSAPDLALTWLSSVDGLLSNDPASPAGLAEASWAYAGRSEGDHEVRLTAVDSCGNSAEDALGICQQAGYTSDELDISAWHFEGVAGWDTANDWLELTGDAANVVGTAFATDAVISGSSVQIRFNFFIGDGTGADGISLTALDVDRMTTFLGGTGCGIGYGGDADCTAGPALPGWSIEVDTYFNDGQDPTDLDHLMLTFDGDVDDPEVWVELPEMEDNGWHSMEVTVEAPHITISVDEVLYIDQDVTGNFDFPAYVGFTAGTGGLTNYHLIESLEVTEYACGE